MAVDLVGRGAKTVDIEAAQKKLGKGQVVNPKGELGKDEFLKLLLVELEHQDPTAPVETDKILSQTSQLASLEASTNTNKELQNLSDSLQSSMKFSTVGAMGKIANIGNDEVILPENGTASFEIYFPDNVKSGSIDIKDTLGNLVRTININDVKKGVNSFNWDGESNDGNRAEEGSYHVAAAYMTAKGKSGQTAIGTYPISSIKFDEGKTMMKLGSQYVPFKMVKELYDEKG
jgi:flagellar basal-body rod modification protein FlgD